MSALLGWLGAIALALCGIPAACKAIRDGHARGLSTAFVALWWIGELAMLAHVIAERSGAALVANYAANAVLVSVIVFFKVRDTLLTLRA